MARLIRDTFVNYVTSGNNVSFSHNCTKRTFKANKQRFCFHSFVFGKVWVESNCRVLRTIERFGGIDRYVMNVKRSRLSPDFLKLKSDILKRSERQSVSVQA